MRLKPNQDGTYFHPFEITFSGYSNSGKTTLISKVTKELSSYYDIGYYKHDAHRFEIDRSGKDTFVIKSSGAKEIFINDSNHQAYISSNEVTQVDISNRFIDSDILLIEGHKHSTLPKILIISNQTNELTLKEIEQGSIKNIDLVVTESEIDPLNGQYPHLQRDNISEISQYILHLFRKRTPQKINGLILTGGKSQRMSQDKGGLIYHEQDQISHTKNLLSSFCNDIFVSCRESQKELPFLKDHQLLFDTFPSNGPASGILSAQSLISNTPWLVIGCDLPYLDEKTISDLIINRNPFKNATCFLNPKRNWPEPLCTIYEPKSYKKLMNYFAYNKPCPRKVLFNSNINALELKNQIALDNVNTPEEREIAKKHFTPKGDNHAN